MLLLSALGIMCAFISCRATRVCLLAAGTSAAEMVKRSDSLRVGLKTSGETTQMFQKEDTAY